MTPREDEIKNFLSEAGWQNAAASPLKSDASNRRYIRLVKEDSKNATRMLMDADPALGEDVRAFIRITELLLARGLSAPKIYHFDTARGFLLLEDFGDTLFKTICEATPDIELTLYEAAIDVLVALHKTAPPADIAPYDMQTYLREAALLTEWYIPAIRGADCAEDADSGTYQKLMRELCAPLTRASLCETTLVLRDYHAENLMWLPERAGAARVGLLDYQDALAGPIAYDLVSLLMDARRDTTRDLQETMITRYLDGRGIAPQNRAEFHSAYHRLGAQRGCKVLGIFARLCLRDGKAHYADLMPRVWQHLQINLAHPDCAALKKWTNKNVPAPTPENIAALKTRADGTAENHPRAAPYNTPSAALIFAAGFGTRMGALTKNTPKPLLPLRDRTLIDYALDHTAALNLRTFINTHYLNKQMQTHLADRPDITLIHESPDILETGGGLKNARDAMQSNPVFTMNSDCLFLAGNPLKTLSDHWDGARMQALLLLIPRGRARAYNGAGDFNLDKDERLIKAAGACDFVYSGAQIIRTDSLDTIAARSFSLTKIWQNLIEQGRAYGVIYDGDWLDAGHPAGLQQAQELVKE